MLFLFHGGWGGYIVVDVFSGSSKEFWAYQLFLSVNLDVLPQPLKKQIAGYATAHLGLTHPPPPHHVLKIL